MGFYDDVGRGLIVRGEQLFPMCCFDVARDWEGIERCLEVIPVDGERFMTVEEILVFYEQEDPGE